MKGFLALAAALALSACGLQPMYAGGGDGAVAQGLAGVSVAPIPGRAGWLVRNALNDRLGGTGEESGGRYRLDVLLDDELEGLGLLTDDTIGRERRTLRARYQLTDTASGKILLDATAGSDAGIDVVSSEYATIAAEQTALENLARDVADRIVTQLALTLRRSERLVKATQRDFAAAAPRAAENCRMFFFCGQDEAGAAAAADKLIALFPEPGERVELSGSDVRKDPALLADEARSTSLFGDKRHILVRAAGDEAHDALKGLADSLDMGGPEPWPVLVVASAATDKSRTAKLLEKRKDALVAMFYPPDLASVTREVRAMADAAGLRLDTGLAERIARGAGLDVRLAKSEVEKLATYVDASLHAPVTARAEDLDAVGARTEEDGFMPLVNAVLSGESGRLAGELHRMREVSMNPVGLLLAFERRAAQLAQLAAKLGPRGDVGALIESETQARRVFFREKAELTQQLRLWQGAKLARLVARLVELHRALLATNQSAELLLAQGLAEITRQAAALKR